jgi:hypothetical protein
MSMGSSGRQGAWTAVRRLRAAVAISAAAVAVAAALGGCAREAAPIAPASQAASASHDGPRPDSPFQLVASIQEIMDAEVDPAADALWHSVGSTITLAGEEDRQPRTREEWQAVRRDALVLIEATNLIAMDGRRAAPVNAPAPLPGELSAQEIDRHIRSNHLAFVQFSKALRGAALEALAAIDARDAPRLMNAGEAIDAACEACHLVYWYPTQAQPSS